MTQFDLLRIIVKTKVASELGWRAKLVVIAPYRHRVEFWHPETDERISGDRVGQADQAFINALNKVPLPFTI